jgi:hypothetical protein
MAEVERHRDTVLFLGCTMTRGWEEAGAGWMQFNVLRVQQLHSICKYYA